jgi:hypothetical protein
LVDRRDITQKQMDRLARAHLLVAEILYDLDTIVGDLSVNGNGGMRTPFGLINPEHRGSPCAIGQGTLLSNRLRTLASADDGRMSNNRQLLCVGVGIDTARQRDSATGLD